METVLDDHRPAVRVRDVLLGRGRTKICIPLMAADLSELGQALQATEGLPFDLVEWRLDCLRDLSDVPGLLPHIRSALPDVPLLATFRSREEGGLASLSDDAYAALYRTLLSGVDLIDVEYSRPRAVRELLCREAGRLNVPVVLSHHDFLKTPSASEMLRLLETMEAEPCDLVKLAVMPCVPSDVAALLYASSRMAEKAIKPLVTMSMGSLGAVSRLAGAVSGSAFTFASAGRESAPGQMNAAAVREALRLLEGN